MMLTQKRDHISWRFKLIRALALSIFLTAALPFAARADVRCESALAENLWAPFAATSGHPKSFDKLSPQSQKFWRRLADQFYQEHTKDASHPKNKKLVQEAVKKNHPQIEFLKKLGVQVNSRYELVFPDFILLWENLRALVDQHNRLPENENYQIKLELNLGLSWQKKSGQEKSFPVVELLKEVDSSDWTGHALKNLLQEASDFKVLDESALMSDPIFFMKLAKGEVTLASLGTLENARNGKTWRQRSRVTGFLHDLGHVGGLLENSDYKKVFFNVARKIHNTGIELFGEEKQRFYRKFNYSHPESDLGFFLFFESAWSISLQEFKILQQMPVLQSLLKERAMKSLKSSEVTQLSQELQTLNENWWRIFQPLGGAARDLFVFDHFFERQIPQWWVTTRSQLPINALARELDGLQSNLKSGTLIGSEKKLKRLLDFLKYAPKLSIKQWEELLLSENRYETEPYRNLSKMFPENNIHEWDWAQLHLFLYGE
jgi:hypothetical protein